MPTIEKQRYVMTSDLRQYIAEYTVANFWRYPIRRRVRIGFYLMRGFIILVNDNHVDNYLKEILAFVYLGSM